jgi:hypothetical protein
LRFRAAAKSFCDEAIFNRICPVNSRLQSQIGVASLNFQGFDLPQPVQQSRTFGGRIHEIGQTDFVFFRSNNGVSSAKLRRRSFTMAVEVEF